MQPKLTIWLALLCFAVSISAQTTWTGTASSNWFNAANWSSGTPSASNQPATLPAAPAGGNFPSIDFFHLINYQLDNFGVLTINANVINSAQLLNGGPAGVIENNGVFSNDVTGSIDNDGTIINNSRWENFGYISTSGSFVNDAGATVVTMPGSDIVNNDEIMNRGHWTNDGTVDNNNTFYNRGKLLNNGVVDNHFGSTFYNGDTAPPAVNGDIENNGLFATEGDFFNRNGSFINNSQWVIRSPGVATNQITIENYDRISNAGRINNIGTLNNNGTLLNDFGSTFDNSGSLFIESCDRLDHLTGNPITNGYIENNGIVYEVGAAVDVDAGTGIELPSVNTDPVPTAICTDTIIKYLDEHGRATVTVAEVDNGSAAPYCGIASIQLSQQDYTCANLGLSSVTLIVSDSLGNDGTCQTVLDIRDTIPPTLNCPADFVVELQSMQCEIPVNYAVFATDNCNSAPVIIQTDTSGLTAGDIFLIGTTVQSYFTQDGNGNSDSCSFTVTVNEYLTTSNILTCNDNSQLSLSTNCSDEVLPEMILMGNYGCTDRYQVEIMGRGTNIVDASDVGKTLMVAVFDTVENNNCMGELVIEDKSPPFLDSCVNDTILCLQDVRPDIYGGAAASPVISDCSSFSVFYYDNYQHNDCSDSLYSKIIKRTWIAEDVNGMTDSCMQLIYIRRVRLSEINPVCPPAFSQQCDENGIYDLSPNITGYPTVVIDSVRYELRDTVCDLCGILPARLDDTLQTCGTSFKILRKWRLFDFCTPLNNTNPWTCLQQIKVEDTKAPDLEPLVIPDASTGADICAAQPVLPPILFTDCSPVEVKIFTTVGVIESNGGKIPAPGLNLGNHSVEYVATDACGNTASQTVPLTVRDMRPPVAVCEGLTTVSITSDGTATMAAATLDDGSHDECCLDRFEVRRMDDNCANPLDTTFQPALTFCCADVGDTVMVTMRAYDCAGNFNDCMVSVIVNNKINPQVTCPPDITLECGRDYEDLNLTGRIVTDSTLRRNIDGFAFTNCEQLDITYRDFVSLSCGAGLVLRTWTVKDADGDVVNCVQRIILENTDPFDGTTDIIWPADTSIEDCLAVADTATTGVPVILDDECDDVMFTFSDHIFSANNACREIARTWTVIDWCQYVPNDPSGKGRWEYTQTITIVDSGTPVLSDCTDRVLCNKNAFCQPLAVDLSVTVSDNCTPNNQLIITWTVDAFNDQRPDAGPQYSGTGMNDSNAYPNGTHKICYTVNDGCGNVSTCCFLFKIIDCIKPTPVCKNGLSGELNQNGTLTLTADYFENGSSSDNCTPYSGLFFSFGDDVNDTSRTFTCADIGYNQVEMWVHDGIGNKAFCSTFIDIQDNMGACTGPKATIAGAITDETGAGVTDVTVQINHSGNPFHTGNDGAFRFDDLPLGADYTLAPYRNDDVLNGMTTFDMVLITKHILGTSALNSPYKIIAADANRSGSVTTLDLVVLRKIILRIEPELPGNTAWRFVPKDYQFADPANPFKGGFPEVYNVNNLTADELAADFVAIKVGDVNDSAKPNTLITTDERSRRKTTHLYTENKNLTAGEQVTIHIALDENESLEGCQFTLDFDPAALQLLEIEPGAAMTRENFGLTLLDEGAVTVSWDITNAQALSFAQTLFSLHFLVQSDGSLSQWLSLSSRFTPAEAYRPDGEITHPKLVFRTAQQIVPTRPPFLLFQNVPNPFSDYTAIGFRLPEAAQVTLTIFDISGRELLRSVREFPEGFNEFSVVNSQLKKEGVLYYRIDTPKHTATRKMIFIK